MTSTLVKRGFKLAIDETFMLHTSGFPQKGHYKEIPLTEDDYAAHARAKAALDEINNNDWISLTGYEYDLDLLPLKPRQEFIPEETKEEWMERWREAGRPDRYSELLFGVSSRMMGAWSD